MRTETQPVPPAPRCEGCDQPAPTRVYRVTYRERAGGAIETVHYCADCAALAEVDWTGDIAACEPLTPTEG